MLNESLPTALGLKNFLIFDYFSIRKKAVHLQKGKSEVKSNPIPSRQRRDLNLADFHLKEKIEYDDKEILLYEDDQGHNYTKTRYNLKKTRDKMLEYPPDEDSNLVLQEDYQKKFQKSLFEKISNSKKHI